MKLSPIAHIHTNFPTKFGIPRQSNIAPALHATIVFEEPFNNPIAFRGLEHFSHIWLIWGFSGIEEDSWSPTVRPPRLGGNARMGVFATRSPYRPNALGLSSVKLDHIDFDAPQGTVLYVSGADLMDGAPIYDVKPYLPYTDSHPNAITGFAENDSAPLLQVHIDEVLLQAIPAETAETLRQILAQDPRPSYHQDPARIYGFEYHDFEVKFYVENDTLTVVEIQKKTS